MDHSDSLEGANREENSQSIIDQLETIPKSAKKAPSYLNFSGKT